MRSLILIGLGFLIGAATLGAVWASVANTPDDPDGAVDVRIVLERLKDGRVEAGLQQREVDGQWGETLKPDHRFLAPEAEVNHPLHSSVIVVDTDSRYETVAQTYADYLFQSGQEIAAGFVERFAAETELPKLLCVEDLNDSGIGNLCDGLASAYGGEVERLAVADYAAFRSTLEARAGADRDFGASSRPACRSPTSSTKCWKAPTPGRAGATGSN